MDRGNKTVQSEGRGDTASPYLALKPSGPIPLLRMSSRHRPTNSHPPACHPPHSRVRKETFCSTPNRVPQCSASPAPLYSYMDASLTCEERDLLQHPGKSAIAAIGWIYHAGTRVRDGVGDPGAPSTEVDGGGGLELIRTACALIVLEGTRKGLKPSHLKSDGPSTHGGWGGRGFSMKVRRRFSA